MKIETIREALKNLPQRTEGVVAMVVGGTSGIGEATTLALSSYLGAGSRIYIVGRNGDAASKLIEECGRRSSDRKVDVKVEFLCQDVALLKDVDKVCRRFAEKEDKLDLLFMSQGYLSTRGRNETSEGIDHLLSLRYYSRMRFAVTLLPLLQRSPCARVLSVYAPGVAERFSFDLSDPGLSRPGNFTFPRQMCHPSFLTTLFMSALAAKNPTVSFIHLHPGWVITPEWQAARFPVLFKWFMIYVMVPILRLFSHDYAECGDRMVWNCFTARCPPVMVLGDEGARRMLGLSKGDGEDVGVMLDLNEKKGGGAYCVDYLNEQVVHHPNMARVREKGGEERVWEHTMEIFESVKSV